MIFSSDFLTLDLVCPKCDKCKLSFVKPKKPKDNPYFTTECGLELQRSWSLLTTSTKTENCLSMLADSCTQVGPQVNFTLDTSSAVKHMNESQFPINYCTVMLGLKEEPWNIPKQQLFTTFFCIDQDFKELIKCIIHNRPFERLKYIEETEDTAEAYLWLAKQEFSEDEKNVQYFFPIDVSFWTFSMFDDEVTVFEDLEYLKNIKERKTSQDPLEQLRHLVSLAEEAAEQGNMKQNTYNEICLWAKTSMSGFKRKRD